MNTPKHSLYRSAEHAEQLAKSGLTVETIELARLRSEKDKDLLRELLGSYPKGHDLGWCLVFPCMLPGDSKPYGHRVRPDNPRTVKDKRRGEPRIVKYESPPGSALKGGVGVLVYFGPRACADGRLKADGIKIWTEGEKKTLLLEQLGYAVVGLTGVSNWHDVAARNPPGAKEGSGPLRLHPLIRAHVNVAGCDHIIAFDSDAITNKQVMREAKKLALTLYEAGARSVSLGLPPAHVEGGELSTEPKKIGIDDYYLLAEARGQSGADAIGKLFATVQLLERQELVDKPEIHLDVDEHRVTDEVCAALGRAPDLYTREYKLVRVVANVEQKRTHGVRRAIGAPIICSVASATLREIISRECEIVQYGGDEGPKPVHPPGWLMDQVLARGVWPKVPPLIGIVDSPTLRPDGTILMTSGYDAQTCVIAQLSPELEALTFPDQPSQQDARAAAAHLLQLVADFPFAGDSDRAAWLAFVVSGFAREAYHGPTPLGLISASTRGTGKTKLAKITGIIITGREPGEASYVHDSTEMAKRITSIALQGDRVVVLDNIDGPVGNEALNRALTSTSWKERLLSKNEMPSLPLFWIPLATANNPEVRDDLLRRILPIRLLSMVECPEERTDFAVDNLEQYTREHRVEYVRDALIILRAFAAAGRPTTGLGTLGSFEGWRDLVAGAVRFAYGIDPLRARIAATATMQDETLVALRALVDAMEDCNSPANGIHAREILRRMGLDDAGREPGNPFWTTGPSSDRWRAARSHLDTLVRRKDRDPPPTAQRLGWALKRHLGRPVKVSLRGGAQRACRLAQADDRGTKVWWVETLGESSQDTSCGNLGDLREPKPYSHSDDHHRSEEDSHARDRKPEGQSSRNPCNVRRELSGSFVDEDEVIVDLTGAE